jgi:hypothetical protein
MARGVARYLVGSLVVLGLAACGRSWLAEREPWRHEAEVACLQTGKVKEGPAVVRIEPITGPGICGADFPYKVSAVGDTASVLSYSDELRPPRAVPSRFPLADVPPGADPSQPYTPAPARTYPQPSASGPMSINPPGTERPEVDDEGEYQLGAPDAPPGTVAPRSAAPAAPTLMQPPVEQVPLGRERPPAASPAVAVQPAATLACPIVSSLDTWIANDVQPAAMKWFGTPLASIRQFSAFSCRTVNNQPGKGLSEHAFGNALDIAIFTFADGRKVNVEHGWRGPPEEQGFLRDIHAAACKYFSTVLGPGADVFHYNHFHLDMRLRRNGYTVCRPNPVPGDVVAGRSPYPRRGEVTGSIKPAKPTRMPAQRIWRNRDEVHDGLPLAVPGED